jgi:hypothetical protein
LNIIIANPNFKAVQQFILDTTITTTQFSYTLQPGKYEWRVRGRNGSSMTVYNNGFIDIDSTLNFYKFYGKKFTYNKLIKNFIMPDNFIFTKNDWIKAGKYSIKTHWDTQDFSTKFLKFLNHKFFCSLGSSLSIELIFIIMQQPINFSHLVSESVLKKYNNHKYKNGSTKKHNNKMKDSF